MLDLIPKNLDFGKDIKKIIFNDDTVIKFFRDKNGFEKTIEFSNFIENNIYFPKIIEKDYKNIKLIQENCGNLLSLNNIPDNWEYQLKDIGNIFKKKKIYILDLRFLLFVLHFFSEIYRILTDIIEIILFRDISIFYETNNIRKYYF